MWDLLQADMCQAPVTPPCLRLAAYQGLRTLAGAVKSMPTLWLDTTVLLIVQEDAEAIYTMFETSCLLVVITATRDFSAYKGQQSRLGPPI